MVSQLTNENHVHICFEKCLASWSFIAIRLLNQNFWTIWFCIANDWSCSCVTTGNTWPSYFRNCSSFRNLTFVVIYWLSNWWSSSSHLWDFIWFTELRTSFGWGYVFLDFRFISSIFWKCLFQILPEFVLSFCGIQICFFISICFCCHKFLKACFWFYIFKSLFLCCS